VSADTRAALRAALEAHLREEAQMPAEEELGDFVVVSCGVSIDAQLRPMARYYLSFGEETLLPHIVAGLLAKGEEVAVQNEDED
jgi:hypothetical protein